MVCALGREDGTIIEQVSIPTTTPEETIPKITAYFKDKGIEALGIGAFGPVGVDPKADNYGYILETPKLAWRNKDLLGGLKKELNVPIRKMKKAASARTIKTALRALQAAHLLKHDGARKPLN